MEPIIDLLKFYYDQCAVKWSGELQPIHELDHRFSIDYHVWANNENKQVHKLQLIARVEPATEKAGGYTIDCSIHGIFAFPDDTDPSKIPGILRMNGLAILYGILRGQIASITGTFDAGVFFLPTINTREVVESIEKQRQKAHLESIAGQSSDAIERSVPRAKSRKKPAAMPQKQKK